MRREEEQRSNWNDVMEDRWTGGELRGQPKTENLGNLSEEMMFKSKHIICVCLRGNAEEGEVKRKMTQREREKGVRAQKEDKRQRRGRGMVVLCGCAGCTIRGCEL